MFEQLLKGTMDSVMADKEDAIKDFESYLENNGWPMGYAKSMFKRAINHIIQEELPDDPEGALIDLLLGQARKAIKITDQQKIAFKQMVKLADAAERKKCQHEDMGIAPFMHGGGFTMMFARPEVICTTCGLNVTLCIPKKLSAKELSVLEKEFGIKTTISKLTELRKWADVCKRVTSASDILRDPISAYNNSSNRWAGKFPFTITDRKKFESKSGH